MGGSLRPSTQSGMLRNHEKDLARLKTRPSPIQQPGVPMTPSSIVGTGAAVGGPGTVLFTAATGAIDIDGIFTPDYEDYLLFLDVYSTSSAQTFPLQLRNASGLYAAASGYRYGLTTAAYLASALAYSSPTAGTSWARGGSSSGAGGGHAELKIFSPARGGTEVLMKGYDVSSSGEVSFWGWCSSAVGQATGIRYSLAGALNGALRVYGINPN